MHEMRNKYQDLRDNHDPKNHLNDDKLMCERHEANYIKSEGYQNQDSHNLFSRQSYHDLNDSEKSLTELNNDVKNDLEDFKRCIRSMRTIHDKLFDRDDDKTTGVLPNKKFKPINQEPQSKTDFEKLMTKFLDDLRVTKQTDRTEPQHPPQAQTEQVNAVSTESGKSDDPSKTQKDPHPPIIIDNKNEKDKPIKTSKRAITCIINLKLGKHTSDDMGNLVGKLVSSAIVYVRCRAFKQVADMKEPFDFSKVKGYRSYKNDHTQANNDLATATFP
ncbi:hypothetical protein Tco_1256987 [Tanacetum coccineum]